MGLGDGQLLGRCLGRLHERADLEAGLAEGDLGSTEGFTTFLGTWDDYHYEVHKLIDCGDEVLVEGSQRARGRGSGVEVSEPIYTVWTVREGRVIRQRMFRDRGQALEAAGLLT